MAKNDVVLITGSSSGFGRLIAETLARNGYRIFATMRGVQKKNASAARELTNLASKESLWLRPIEMDVTSDSSVEAAVNAAVADAGRIDVVVNNAGYGLMGVTEAVTIEQAQRLMDTNFMGVARVNRAVLPHMRRQKSGLLIHISSGGGRIVVPSMAFYCPSKWALEALAEAYRYELAPQGIDSVIIQPGAYVTSVFGNMEFSADKSRTETYGEVNGIAKRVIDLLSSGKRSPQEIADAVLKTIETPFGQRKLRQRLGGGAQGIVELNELSERTQAQVLQAFGLAEITKAAAGQAAGGH